MKKLILATIFGLNIFLINSCSVVNADQQETPKVPVFGESYKCPDDGGYLYYTGRDEWCVGINCSHVKYYKCSVCNRVWGIYMPKGE